MTYYGYFHPGDGSSNIQFPIWYKLNHNGNSVIGQVNYTFNYKKDPLPDEWYYMGQVIDYAEDEAVMEILHNPDQVTIPGFLYFTDKKIEEEDDDVGGTTFP